MPSFPVPPSPHEIGASSPPPTRTQRRAAANRQSVIDAAREIVATEGMGALTLEAVAERADVAVATIYNRVGNRSSLLLAVAEQAMEESRAYMDAAYAAEGTAEERLLLVATTWVRFARERPHEFRILVEPADQPDAVARLAELTRTQNAKLADAIRAGMATGAVRPDLEPDQVATALWASLNGVLALAWRPGELRVEAAALDQLMAAFIAIAADGLRAH
ncbi:TetR/AcrR family transcriptional regulator [Antrihabitans sp. YC2-6]|uniref:TetR/AcrR family transcriptional regulator n=1 Tax=Antrihabitans sp. YC2-6 TaxID=2799498 RepID=UPI0018F76FA7|nr:TetR/AcrR family transcriptional regulator [Antrihabitans sp. YC2-6]MBJ8346964.1 TetR/AcrR family transcriptional regulator [Antrihabitans sp. YC2-6]